MSKSKKASVFFSIRALTIAAMLTAMSVVIGMFCKTFLNFSGGLFRITFENLPIIISGIIFGPLAGGIVGAGSDLISYLLSPQIYPPNLTVTLGAFTVGAVSGLVSRMLGTKTSKAKITATVASAHTIGSMLIKTVGLYSYYGILVLWRIPLYVIIASIEIIIICLLYKNTAIRKLFEGARRPK